MQLNVIKADGSSEPYLHTKVMATFVNAFAEPSEKNTYLAAQLAESVTFYLYNNRNSDVITSSEIFSIIKAVLSSTGFDAAAQVLTEHNYRRNLLRSRVEVVKTACARIKGWREQTAAWNKSKIINDLMSEQKLDSASARAIASLVEEKILNSGFYLIPTDFIKFLVNWLMQSFVGAEKQNSSASMDADSDLEYQSVRDDRIRQLQNGLCNVKA